MRALSDTDSPPLPRRADDLAHTFAHLPAGWPHDTPYEAPPGTGSIRRFRNPRSGRVGRNRILALACTAAITAAVLLGLVEFSSPHRVFGGPDPIDLCPHTDSGNTLPP